MMDPEAFENPLDFWPERYVAHELGLKASAVANGAAEYWRNTFPFGAGRRICIGLHFAEVELFTVSKSTQPISSEDKDSPDD